MSPNVSVQHERYYITPDGKSRPERRHQAAMIDGKYHGVSLMSGECYISSDPEEVIVTILGSCVAACMRDPVTGVGGMNHFLLPDGGNSGNNEPQSARYGVFAMELLINGILAHGGHKNRLETKVFGGGNVMASSAMIGDRNAQFIRSFLHSEKLLISSEDLGGNYPRRVRYYPTSGRVQLLRLRRKEDMAVVEEERKWAESLNKTKMEGSVELF